jgi:nicotinate-nucleotide adenylyltransferase
MEEPDPPCRCADGVQGGRRRIGILGGSFNPAHPGHRHISLLALERLRLHEVWWLVSPQNPLKPVKGMAPLAERLAGARRAARHPRIKVSDLELKLGTRYTADTVRALKRRFPRNRFVWLMGADNLYQIIHWQNWTRIFTELSIAVFDRPSYSGKALAGKAANRFRRCRLRSRAARFLADRRPPAWVFLHSPLHPASATTIRQTRPAASATSGVQSSGPGKPPSPKSGPGKRGKGDRNHSKAQSKVAQPRRRPG